VFSVQPSLISRYKEQQLITAEILPRQERFQQTVRCLLDKVRLEHAAPAPVISPLKTRPLTTPQSTSSRDVGSATSSWGGSRIGSGSLSKKDKQKLKRRRCTTRNSRSEENFAVSESKGSNLNASNRNICELKSVVMLKSFKNQTWIVIFHQFLKRTLPLRQRTRLQSYLISLPL
jgi:hypothetical protein